MADSAGLPHRSALGRSSPPGIENPNPVASTSAHTLDTVPTTAPNISLPKPPIGKDSTTSTPAPPPSTSAAPSMSSLVVNNSDSSDQSLANPPATSNSSAIDPTTGLNEEDAKLLASLAEGNGLFSQLSSLAQAQASNPLYRSLADPSKIDQNAVGLGLPPIDDDAYNGAVDLNEALTRNDMDWDEEYEELVPEDGEDEDQGPIQAYAKLEFPGFSYYIQTLDVSIGRRPGQLQTQAPGTLPPQLPNAASGVSQAHITSESKAEGDVDVDLGPLKSISRLHARIFYYTGLIQPPSSAFLNGAHTRSVGGVYQQNAAPFRITSPSALQRVHGGHADPQHRDVLNPAQLNDQEEGNGQFVLSVVGRNGAFVDDVWVEKGGLVVLGKRTKIQIAERVFYFVLPPPPDSDPYETDLDAKHLGSSDSESLSELDSDEDDQKSIDTGDSQDQDQGDVHEGSDAKSSDLSEISDAELESPKARRRSSTKSKIEALNAEKPRRRLVLKPKSKVAPPSSSHGKGKGKGQGKGKLAARGKMPTKGPIPSEADREDDDSLGTPSEGEGEEDQKRGQNEDEPNSDDDDIKTPPPPPARTSGKRPTKGTKGGKGSKATKAEKATRAGKADSTRQSSTTEGSPERIKMESPAPSWTSGAGVASRKRKRGETTMEDEPTLKVGTPIGIEALQVEKRAKAAKARADATSSSASKGPASPSKAKSSITATPASNTATDADDVVMVDVKAATSAPSTAVASNLVQIAPAPPSTSALPPTSASSPTQTAVQATTDANSKAKTVKPKTTKSKKKKGATEEVASAQNGVVPTVPTVQPLPPFNSSHASMVGGTGSNAFSPPGMPPSFDPNSASAASAIIAAANAVSGSMPTYNQGLSNQMAPSITSMPFAPSSTPISRFQGSSAPSSLSSKAPAASTPSAGLSGFPTGMGSTSANSSPSANASWPSTASIIASAASLANAAQAKANSSQNAPNGAASSTSSAGTPAPIKPPPGPEDKPDLSNVELISHALRSDHCAKKGGKLTLQEVYEWIANRWVWFKRNGRHTGRDWQSSIRHAIGSSRDFTRIPRRSDEPGKGIFYTMSDSELAKQHRENLAKQKEEASKAAAATAANPSPSALAGSVSAGMEKAAGAAASAVAAGKPGTSPASLPAIKIPLIIGTPPSAASSAASNKPKAAPGTIESLLETPPIVHHDGKLYLSPQVFGHLNAGQLAQIESLGAQQALQVLQAYLVTHLKERMRLQQVAQQKNESPTASTPGQTASPSQRPTQSVPTAKNAPVPTTPAAGSAPGVSVAPTAASSLPGRPTSVTAAPAKSQPGSAVPSAMPALTSLPRPVLPSPTKPTVPPAGSTTSASSSSTSAVNKAANTAGSGMPNRATAILPAIPTTSKPSIATPVLPSTPLKSPTPAAPSSVAKSVASAVAPSSTPAAASASTTAATSSSPSVPGSSSTAPAPSPAVAPKSAPGTISVPASTVAAPGATSGPSAGAATASSPSTATATSDDPLSALSALAAHPEAAGLIALLRKQQQEGGGQMAKLTPGQLQLLQMANKLAAQQKKNKKKKKVKDGTPTPGAVSGSPAPAGSPAGGGVALSPSPSVATGNVASASTAPAASEGTSSAAGVNLPSKDTPGNTAEK